MGPRGGLNTEAKAKIIFFCRGSNLDRPVLLLVERFCLFYSLFNGAFGGSEYRTPNGQISK
jgi:hypothetical protein